MSLVDDLIQRLCPDGVEFKPLGNFAELVRGNGMPKRILVDEGVGAIHYGQIYSHYGAWATKTLSFVATDTAVKLAKVDPGDVIITNTSENIEDVGKAVAWLGDDQIVTGGHATVIKHAQDAKFLAYWFASADFNIQKRKLATGTKVIDVSARQLATIRVPVPPLGVQSEIVRVLDKITQLEADLRIELKAELKARRRQYDFYRDSLLTFHDGTKRVAIGELGTIFGGLTGKVKADFSSGNARFVSYTNVFNNIAVRTEVDDFVRVGPRERQRSLAYGDIIFTGSSESANEAGMTSVVTTQIEEPLYLNSFCIGFRPNSTNILNPEFAKHLFRSGSMRSQIIKTANGVTRFNVSKVRLAKVKVPIPDRAEQERIADILDDLEALTKDVSVDLLAELAARRKQYEHYLDRLLTFKELVP